jgi:hypothetical protein
MSRQDLYQITVSAQTSVNGPLVALGRFDRRSGGNVTASDTKYRPGASPVEVSLGGPRTVENVTISRLYDLDRDHELAKRLATVVGQGRVSVAQQPLDSNYVAWGTPTTWNGILTRVTWPDADSSGNAASLLELEVSTAGGVG